MRITEAIFILECIMLAIITGIIGFDWYLYLTKGVPVLEEKTVETNGFKHLKICLKGSYIVLDGDLYRCREVVIVEKNATPRLVCEPERAPVVERFEGAPWIEKCIYVYANGSIHVKSYFYDPAEILRVNIVGTISSAIIWPVLIKIYFIKREHIDKIDIAILLLFLFMLTSLALTSYLVLTEQYWSAPF